MLSTLRPLFRTRDSRSATGDSRVIPIPSSFGVPCFHPPPYRFPGAPFSVTRSVLKLTECLKLLSFPPFIFFSQTSTTRRDRAPPIFPLLSFLHHSLLSTYPVETRQTQPPRFSFIFPLWWQSAFFFPIAPARVVFFSFFWSPLVCAGSEISMDF